MRLSDLPKVTEQISDTSENEPRRPDSFTLPTGKMHMEWKGQSAFGRSWMDQATVEKGNTHRRLFRRHKNNKKAKQNPTFLESGKVCLILGTQARTNRRQCLKVAKSIVYRQEV